VSVAVPAARQLMPSDQAAALSKEHSFVLTFTDGRTEVSVNRVWIRLN
jgi:hypothetical protein